MSLKLQFLIFVNQNNHVESCYQALTKKLHVTVRGNQGQLYQSHGNPKDDIHEVVSKLVEIIYFHDFERDPSNRIDMSTLLCFSGIY